MDDDKRILGDVIVWYGSSLLGRGGVNRFTYQHLKLMKNKINGEGYHIPATFKGKRKRNERSKEKKKGKKKEEKKRKRKKKGQES